MQIFVERIENPNQEFWIWDKRITNKTQGRTYPSTSSNVGSGESVAVYRVDEGRESRTQIAQLELPDYEKLTEYYNVGKVIILNYTYIDDFRWLGDKLPYEVESLPYAEREGFSAQGAFFNNLGNEAFIHIMQSHIKRGYLDFSYSIFCNINLCLTNLTVEEGNLWFNNARFFDAHISLTEIMCGGDRLFSPEISFNYISADSSEIGVVIMSQKLSIGFLCARTTNTTIMLDPLPAAFNEVCLTRATVNNVAITNADIGSLDISKANINTLEFTRCKFLGYSCVEGNIDRLYINDSLISNVFKLALTDIKKLAFSNTLNNGKLYIQEFGSCIKAILNTIKSDVNSNTAEQLLMLKESFRQNGEYQNEDVCHFHYQKMKTKYTKNFFVKAPRLVLDAISGYGTKPFRMLVVILLTIVLFGTLYYLIPCLSYHGASTWIEHIYTSGITFFAVGYGDLYPLNTITKMVSLVEAFLGVTATSYFLVLISRKVIR